MTGSSKFCFLLLMLGLSVVFCRETSPRTREDKQFWFTKADQELTDALHTDRIFGVAKNIIFFVGDGMGQDTVTATRIYKGQKNGMTGEENRLVFERFPHIGLLKTYAVDRQVPDSASTATALFCGVKTNYEMVGLDATVKLKDCKGSLNSESHLSSVLQWAQEAGKDTGFVTTTHVTHATPASLYAHSADRHWECDGEMGADKTMCKDIARQLVEDEPGINIKVIMGGGRQMLKHNTTATASDPIDPEECIRQDGKNLIAEWENDKKERGMTYKYLNSTKDLEALDIQNTEYVLGIFANTHMAYDYERDRTPEGQPSLAQMTETAIRILEKNPNGFFLMVEGGRIDHGHHAGFARKALEETSMFDDAIFTALRIVNLQQTLVLVTSDHSHTMTMGGYPTRGNDILGIGSISDIDGLPYTTLSYANGFGYNYSTNGTHVIRDNPSKVNTTLYTYRQQAAVLEDDETHSASDVLVYARGPMAHLFHTIHEQSYTAHVVGFAAGIGPYKERYGYMDASPKTNANIFLLIMLAITAYHI